MKLIQELIVEQLQKEYPGYQVQLQIRRRLLNLSCTNREYVS